MPHSGPVLDKPVQLSTMLDVGLKDRPDDLMSLEGTWSWFELEQATSRLAAHYLALKLGDRVASLVPNRIASALGLRRQTES